MAVYSPIAATYGSRVEQFLESDRDYIKYHDKLNRKLQNLRRRCKIVTKDTKKYSTKEKYSKVTADDYDKKNKLYGALMLLHIERDLSLCEILKLRARQRGKLKKSEKKIVTTRLKKAKQTSERLVKLTQNESQWITRSQYLIYSKLVYAEYLVYGKHFKRKENDNISRELALAFAGLRYLNSKKYISDELFESLRTRYEYTLMQFAGDLVSADDLHNFIANIVLTARENKDELASLLYDNGFEIELRDIDIENKDKVIHINWRSFVCQIHDPHLAQLIEEAKNAKIDSISDYSNKIMKWEDALAYQEKLIGQNDENTENEENEQILLAYIKYQALMTSVSRENSLFVQLWSEWLELGTSLSSKLFKFKELDRIVNNLNKYIHDIMELPGIYSDDELLAELELASLYFTSHVNSGCLANLFQTKRKYMEALALYTNSYEKLQNTTRNVSILPNELLSTAMVEELYEETKSGLSSVIALAEYEKLLQAGKDPKYDATVIEKIDHSSIQLKDVKLNNLFPLNPSLIPVGTKPTLFDLAFNYIDYNDEKSNNINSSERSTPEKSAPDTTITSEKTAEEPSKKRGFLGLFGR